MRYLLSVAILIAGLSGCGEVIDDDCCQIVEDENTSNIVEKDIPTDTGSKIELVEDKDKDKDKDIPIIVEKDKPTDVGDKIELVDDKDKEGDVKVENIKVELLCACNGKIYDAGTIVKTIYANNTVSYKTHFIKDVDALLGRHADLTPRYRVKGSNSEFVELSKL